MPRLPAREQTARHARNRLMVDHSPPRDARKRKFQKLDRPSTTHRSQGASSFSTLQKIAVPSPSGAVQSVPQHTIAVAAEGVSFHDLDHDAPGSLPVKNKVCLPQCQCGTYINNTIDSERLPSRVLRAQRRHQSTYRGT